MKVSSPVPAPPLSSCLERILVIEHYQLSNPFILPLFATGVPVLLFQTANGDIDGQPTNNLTLFGQTVFPKMLTIKDNFTLIAYFFKPVALHAIFEIPAHQLTDSPLSLEMLEGNAARELKERLLEAQTVAAMLQLLNGYILQLVNKAEEFHTRSLSRAERAAHAANEVASCRSRELLADVQKKLYMSERTFQRLFKETVGLTPNLYRRVYQFNAAFQQLNRNQFTKLSDVAFQNGYADQSHYIRTFREFTGITPKRYLNWASGV